MGWKSLLCLQKCCGFHGYSTQQMPAQDARGQRVWNRKMLLPRATALEKQHGSTFTCTIISPEEIMILKERENAPVLPIACPGSQGGNLAKHPPGASYRFQLLPVLRGSPKSQAFVMPCKRQGQRKVCLLAIECSSSFPTYKSSPGLYHSSTLAPKDPAVANAEQAAHVALLG